MKLLPQISLQINNPIQIHRFNIKNPFDRLPQAVRHPSNRNRVKAHSGAPSSSHIRRESWVHTQQRLCNSNPSEEPKRHQVSHNPHQLWVLRASWALWMSLHKRWRIAIFLSHCAWNGEVGYLCLNLLPFPVFQIPPTVPTQKENSRPLGFKKRITGLWFLEPFLFLVLFFGWKALNGMSLKTLSCQKPSHNLWPSRGQRQQPTMEDPSILSNLTRIGALQTIKEESCWTTVLIRHGEE